ncbi:farnesol dehydrogenase-like [Chrysoperla carnea]|uniref:farnesol dehydrogenase-like n=1 Tax=Chrysoperla carnea TaxID=189513 RepID=UPI001D05DDA8|nr:farnesol dehydrogenase-like [Chrysoperla carnea]
MEQWKGKTAIVTGASAGIGAEIVKQLAKHDIKVFALARRAERLQELVKSVPGGQIYPLCCDISKEEDILRVFAEVKRIAGGVDILINNAGIIVSNFLFDGETSDWERLFKTNVIGLCVATREACKSMMERDVNGHIIHINSVLGHHVPAFAAKLVGLNAYPASKHAVTGLAETLRLELLNNNNNKIKVTSVSPGLVDTELDTAANKDFIANARTVMKPLDPIDVANAVVYALSTPPHALVAELTIRPIDEP